MKVNDIGKLVLLLTVGILAFVLVLFADVKWTDVDWIIASIVGYATGNGVLAQSKRSPSPMIGSRERRKRKFDER